MKKSVNDQFLDYVPFNGIDDKPKVTTNTQMIPVNSHQFYIRGEILEPEYYSEEIDTINNLSEHDTCDIYLNTEGGSLSTAMEFLNAFDNTLGTVRVNIVGNCMSAGSFIALRAHEIYVGDHIAFMVHSPSGGFLGKFEDAHAQSDFYKEFTNNLYKDIYQGFLTEEEIDKVLDGKTYYMGSEEVKNRLDKRQELFEALRELEEVEREDVELSEGGDLYEFELELENIKALGKANKLLEFNEEIHTIDSNCFYEDGWRYCDPKVSVPDTIPEYIEYIYHDDSISRFHDVIQSKDFNLGCEIPFIYREITREQYLDFNEGQGW